MRELKRKFRKLCGGGGLVKGEGLFGWAYRPADGFHLVNGLFGGLLGDKPSHKNKILLLFKNLLESVVDGE